VTRPLAKVIELQYPIEDYRSKNGEMISKITLQPPKAKHLRKFTFSENGIDMDQVFCMASSISGLPNAMIDTLEAPDAMNVFQGVMDFLERGPETTEK
jgi:hypothetical protein